MGLALAVRFLNYRGVFHGGEIYFFGTDSYAHMRRIWLCVLHYPLVALRDPYLNFPEGATWLWPPGFDLLLATAARLVSPSAPELRTAETVAACAIPFLGLLSLWAAGRIAQTVEGAGAAILTIVLLAMLPAHVLPTRLGNVDHHVMELAFLAGLSAFWMEAARRPETARSAAVGGGVLLAFAFGFWSGAHLFGALLSAGFLAGCAWDAWKGHRELALERAQRHFLAIAALAVIPIVMLSPFSRGFRFTFMGVSWLHPVFLLLCLAGLAVGQAALGRVGRLPVGRRGSALGLLILLASLALALVCVLPRVVPVLGEMVAYVLRKDPQAIVAAEAVPITAFPPAFTLHFFSFGLLLAPPALVALLARGGRTRATLVGWSLATGMLALLQPVRLGSYFGIFLAAVIACVTTSLWRAGGVQRAAAALVAILAVLPGAAQYRASARVETLDGNPWFSAVEEVLAWMRTSTPPTSGWDDPGVRPEYSVLAQWSYGNWINFIGRRPTVANPFGVSPWHLRGFEDSVRFMLSPTEKDADRIARARITRYVIATPILYTYLPLARAIGQRTDSYVVEKEGETRYRPNFFRLMANRLSLFDGSAESAGRKDGIPALERYRLVYEGGARTTGGYTAEGSAVVTPAEISFAKVFERVEGALLTGRGDPFARVEASLDLVTNQGRRFTWRASTRTDVRGAFALRVPYASVRTRAGEVGATQAYRLSSGGRSARVEVADETVRRGGVISVTWASGRAVALPARRHGTFARGGFPAYHEVGGNAWTSIGTPASTTSTSTRRSGCPERARITSRGTG